LQGDPELVAGDEGFQPLDQALADPNGREDGKEERRESR
jgi:hypothetical protein